MVSSYVLVEGLRAGARLDGIPLTLKAIERYAVEDAAPTQPPLWTTVEFAFAEEDAERVAEKLADVLDENGGWYTDFTLNDETVVIFAHRVFRYRTGDTAARAEVAAYGRAHGVPEHQLDWSESAIR